MLGPGEVCTLTAWSAVPPRSSSSVSQPTMFALRCTGCSTTGTCLPLRRSGASDWGAAFVYSGDTEVHVGVERSQWYLDIAPALGKPPIQYDLLVAAQRAQTYWDCFPGGLGVGLPGHTRQLPPGLSWCETLPDVLAWIDGRDVAEAINRARDQRYVVMWPDSPKAAQLRRRWQAQGLPTPDQR